MLIIGLSGKKGSGKNTLAADIVQRFYNPCKFFKNNHNEDLGPFRVTEYAFADTLKQYCQQLFGLTHSQCYGTDAEKNTPTLLEWDRLPFKKARGLRTHPIYLTGREVLQIFGTDIVRSMNVHAWVRATLGHIAKDHHHIALITDVRFPNEVEGIQLAGGKVIRLTRAPYPNDRHPSETALDCYGGFDMFVDNAVMTIEEQRVAVLQLVEMWLD